MTFSDSRIVKLLTDDFIPVWEAVAPVREVTFDLGEGRSVRGAVGGEIVIYFCTPEGRVFDILPALQSPAATRVALQNALAFYKKHDGKMTPEIVSAWHLKRMRNTLEIVWKDHPEKFKKAYPQVEAVKARQIYPEAKKGESKREDYISNAMDDATRAMRVMTMSKSAPIRSRQNQILTVVEPGGRGYYGWQIGRAFLGKLPLILKDEKSAEAKKKPGSFVFPSSPGSTLYGRISDKKERAKLYSWNRFLKTPTEWKYLLFEGILYQPLKGGKVTYNSESLEAISIFEE